MNIACVQFDPQLGDWAGNVGRVERLLTIGPGDVDVLLLPELAFTGYCFRDRAEIEPFAEEVPGGRTLAWCRQTALRLHCVVVCGFVERSQTRLFNAQATFDPQGTLVHVHRKNFLYETDKTWATEGGAFACREIVGLGPCGFAICMDLNPKDFTNPWDAFEFASSLYQPVRQRGEKATRRAHRLLANLVLTSANWLRPQGDEFKDGRERSRFLMNYWAARMEPALGWPIVLAVANRVGAERGITFAGTSCVLDLQERTVLGNLDECEEGILVVRDVPTYRS